EAAEWGRDTDAEGLLEASSSESETDRARAAVAWGRIQDPASSTALIELLADPVRDVRHAAAFALGQLGLAPGARVDAAVVSALVETLDREDDSSWRATVVQSLGKQADPGLEATFAELLRSDPDAGVREEAAHALMRFRFVPTWRGEADEPPAWSDDASTALIAALDDGVDDVRAAATHALSRYPWAPAIEALAARSGDPDRRVRVWAVRGVGRSGASEDAARIAWGLDDADAGVRSEAVSAFVRLARAVDLPDRLAQDPSFHVRAAFAGALSDESRIVAEDHWTRLLEDESPTVRSVALASWTARHGAAALERLSALAKTEDPLDRIAAANAARGLDAAGRDLLVTLSGDGDANVAATALVGLGSGLDDDAVVAALDRALADDRLAVRGTAVGLLPQLPEARRLERIRSAWETSGGVDWVEVREGLVDAAKSLAADPAAHEFLMATALADPMASVRARAAAVLDELEIAHDAPGTGSAGDDSTSTVDPRFDPATLVRFAEPPVIEVETSKGAFRFETFPDEAPVHVANLVTLVRDGFYDGLPFHRVVPNFVIQGGDPTGTGWGGPGWALPDEIHPRPFASGTLGMPKAGKDTGGCQWFFTHLPTPHLDGNYTVFGEIVEGADVVDRIEIGDRIVAARIVP
ncbi:MAG: peptidylprolyl isomerase, partial [Planctomycetota bacterium]|nr:peptidylprolyl isomerase [Planctomycetota bacterium]